MESWSGREFSFFPNFPTVYSFAEHPAYPHSLIQFLTHSFILPTFIEHLLCPSSGLSTLRDAVWMPNDCLAPLFYSFSISPTQISTISRAPSLGAIIQSPPCPFCHSSADDHLLLPVPSPHKSHSRQVLDFVLSPSLPQPQLSASTRHFRLQVISLQAFHCPYPMTFGHLSLMYIFINYMTCVAFNPCIKY